MENLTLINGNNQPYNVQLPKLVIVDGQKYNQIALDHITENTGLVFTPCWNNGIEAQPKTSEQIVKLFLTYNFKTRYYNNWDIKNTILLKSDHHVGFDVESICFECCQKNRIRTNGLEPGDRLAC